MYTNKIIIFYPPSPLPSLSPVATRPSCLKIHTAGTSYRCTVKRKKRKLSINALSKVRRQKIFFIQFRYNFKKGEQILKSVSILFIEVNII